MGARSEYAPGAFSWAELATSDAAAAKQFYGSLFGWEADDRPISENAFYTMLGRGGDHFCALYEMDDAMRGRGVPPNWLSYVTVEDADAAGAKAEASGGGIHAPAFDVMSFGRMAVLTDPAGAVFAVWQPREHIGATRVNDIGCLCWNELWTSNMDGAASFYSDLFGWKTDDMDTGEQGPPYKVIMNGDRSNGGITILPDEGGAPPNWVPYFGVESCEAAAAKVGELGGTVVAGPVAAGPGTIAVALDTQGAAFALYEGQFDD